MGTHGVSRFETEVVVLDAEVEVWEDELFTNLLPDDSGHFISIEFDYWVCHCDFRLVPNHRSRETSLGQVYWAGEVTSRPRQHLRQQVHPASIRKGFVGRRKGEVERKGKAVCVRLKKLDVDHSAVGSVFCLRGSSDDIMADTQLPFAACLEFLAKRVPQHLKQPKVGIICGSGLSTLAASFTDTVYVPYGEIPGFGTSTVQGHKSSLAFGLCGGVSVVAMLGRFHAYEGYAFQKIMFPVRVMARLGVKSLVVTNAAGSLNPNIPVGTIVVLHDHLGIPNLSGFNPLLGPQHDLKIPRFLPTSNAYSTTLRRLFFHAVHELGYKLDDFAEGTYAWVSGPTYESPAEGRFLRAAGADLVGMSTVPEVLAAKEEGLEVIALSLATNFVIIPDTYRSIKAEVKAELEGEIVENPPQPVVSHEEVLEIGLKKAEVMRTIIERVIQKIP